MTLDSGNIRFMQIFAVILKIFVNFPDFMPTPVYYVYTYLTLLPVAAVASCKVRTSGDVASGLTKCDPQSICNLRKNCRSFVDATSSES